MPNDLLLGDDVEASCPECGSDDFAAWEYNFGMDTETGYVDAGIRCKFRTCGHEEDENGFVRRVKAGVSQ